MIPNHQGFFLLRKRWFLHPAPSLPTHPVDPSCQSLAKCDPMYCASMHCRNVPQLRNEDGLVSAMQKANAMFRISISISIYIYICIYIYILLNIYIYIIYMCIYNYIYMCIYNYLYMYLYMGKGYLWVIWYVHYLHVKFHMQVGCPSVHLQFSPTWFW